MGPFKKGDKVVFKSDAGNEKTMHTVRWCNSCGDVTLEERGECFVYSQFILVEPPKPPSFKENSFKSFLSPMCRVEMRGYGIVMFDGTYFVAKSSIACRAASYTSGDGRYKKDDSEFRCFDILRVYKSPDHGYGYPLLEDKGELLWESPEIVTKRKEKDEKIAFKQIEINMAQRKLDELVKQLKEIE